MEDPETSYWREEPRETCWRVRERSKTSKTKERQREAHADKERERKKERGVREGKRGRARSWVQLSAKRQAYVSVGGSRARLSEIIRR